ncbi:MAG: DivIVA domain-containing protein [Flammeovirgaceae bacterium]|jgi:DivIVA domain-containing protein
MSENAKVLPIDVRHKSFNTKTFGGYNQAEVQDFLGKISFELFEEKNENRILTRENERLNKELERLRELEYVLVRQSQETEVKVKRIVEQSQKEGRLVVMKAENNAAVIIETAKSKASKIYTEIKTDCEIRMREIKSELELASESFGEVNEYTTKLMEQMQQIVDENSEKIGILTTLKSNKRVEAKLKASQALLDATFQKSALELENMLEHKIPTITERSYTPDFELDEVVESDYSVEDELVQPEEYKEEALSYIAPPATHQKASTPLTNLERLQRKQRKIG